MSIERARTALVLIEDTTIDGPRNLLGELTDQSTFVRSGLTDEAEFLAYASLPLSAWEDANLSMIGDLRRRHMETLSLKTALDRLGRDHVVFLHHSVAWQTSILHLAQSDKGPVLNKRGQTIDHPAAYMAGILNSRLVTTPYLLSLEDIEKLTSTLATILGQAYDKGRERLPGKRVLNREAKSIRVSLVDEVDGIVLIDNPYIGRDQEEAGRRATLKREMNAYTNRIVIPNHHIRLLTLDAFRQSEGEQLTQIRDFISELQSSPRAT